MQAYVCIDPTNENEAPKPKKTKNKFTEQEDKILKQFVDEYGAHTWARILPLLPGRTSRQVRERYVNYLQPNIKHNEWTKEEDELILDLVLEFGKRWSYISRSFDQRTDVSIKNRYLLLKRKEQKSFRDSLYPKLANKKKNQPVQNMPLENNESENIQFDDQPFNNFPDFFEEQNYQIGMIDSDNDFFMDDNFTNDLNFQFFE